MTTARPVLGYPTRTKACAVLRANGLSNPQIVDRFARAGEHITCKQVAALLHCMPLRAPVRLSIPRTVIDALDPHAQRRGVPVAELVNRLLETIATESMVDAVLDDKPAPAHRQSEQEA